jgi:hypothetical protein
MRISWGQVLWAGYGDWECADGEYSVVFPGKMLMSWQSVVGKEAVVFTIAGVARKRSSQIYI